MFKRSKNVRFHPFCTSMYASQRLCNFRKGCMQRLRVAYNFGCRALYNVPWRASVSSHQVQCHIPTFEALLRKNVYLFLERCRKPNNVWLRALMQSGCYIPHSLKTTTEFYFVAECSDIAVFVLRAYACHNTFVHWATWPWTGLDSVSYSGWNVVPSVTG